MTFDPTLLREPDATLLLKGHSQELTERLTYYTVPLMFFESSADPTNPRPQERAESGSGVLVELWGHHLILTAGHCAQLYEKRLCAFGVDTVPHRYLPSPKWRYEYRYRAGGLDVGYISIPE